MWMRMLDDTRACKPTEQKSSLTGRRTLSPFCHPVCRTLYHVTVCWNAILHIASHSCFSTRSEIRDGGRVLGREIFSHFLSMAIARARVRHRTNSIFSKGSLARFFPVVFAVQETFWEIAQPLPPQKIIVSPLMDWSLSLMNALVVHRCSHVLRYEKPA